MFNIEFETKNAAFQDDNFTHEVKRILDEIADDVAEGITEGSILDINGDVVGQWSW